MGYFYSSATPAVSNPDILFWPCNDGSGTTITATVGAGSTNFDGTWSDLTGGNYALALNGSQKADSSANITYGASSITVKFKIKATSWSGGATPREIINSAGSNRFRIYNAYNNIYFLIYNGSPQRYVNVSTSTYLATGSWHDVAIHFNSVATTGSFELWIDGVLMTPSTGGSGNLSNANFDAGILTVGAASNGHVGEIDALEIWAGNQTP